MIYILYIMCLIACLSLCHVERSETSLLTNTMQLVLPTSYCYDASGNLMLALLCNPSAESNIWRKRPRLCPETLPIQSHYLTNLNPLYV